MAITKEKFVLEVDNRGAIISLKKWNKEVGDMPASAGKATSSLNMLKGAFAAIGGALVVQKMVQFGTAVIQTGAKFETLAMQMEAVTGSAKAADEAMDWITKFTANTPYQLDQVSKSFVKLKAMGLDPMDGTMQAVADATSMLGGEIETMDSIVLALGKSFTKGKMQAEELNMMAERGVPVYRLLSEQLGVTEQAIFKMSEKGELGRDALEGLIEGIQGWAGGSSQKMMDTFAGKWSNLQDKITEALNILAKGGALDAATDAVGELIDVIDKLSSSGKLDDWAKKAAVAFEMIAKVGKFTFSKLPIWIEMFVQIAEKLIIMLARKFLEQMTNMLKGVDFLIEKIPLLGDKFDSLDGAIEGLEETTSTLMDTEEELVAMYVDNEMALAELNRTTKKAEENQRDLANAAENTTRRAFEQVSALSAANSELERMAMTAASIIAERRQQNSIIDAIIGENVAARAQEVGNLWDTIMDFEVPDFEIAAVGEEFTRSQQQMIKELDANFAQMWQTFGEGFSGAITSVLEGGDISDAWAAFAHTSTSQWADQFTSVMMQGFSEGFGKQPILDASGNIIGYQGADARQLVQAGAGMVGNYLMSRQNFNPQTAAENPSTWESALGGGLQGYASSGGNMYAALAGAFIGAFSAMEAQRSPLEQAINFSAQGSRVMPGDNVSIDTTTELQLASITAQLNAAYATATTAYRDMVQVFGDPDLLETLKLPAEMIRNTYLEGPVAELTPEEVAQWGVNTRLPQLFEEAFQASIVAGLSGIGMHDEAIADLFGRGSGEGAGYFSGLLSQFEGANRIDELMSFIQSAVAISDIITEGTIEALDSELAKSSMDQFLDQFEDFGTAISVVTSGFDELNLLQRANEINDVVAIMQQAAGGLAQLKTQAESLRESIATSIAKQIEGIQLGGMTQEEKLAYYQQDIARLQKQFAGASDLETIQDLTTQLQQRYSQIQSTLGDDIYSMRIGGGKGEEGLTYADWLQQQLEQLDAMAGERIDLVVDRGEEAYNALYDQALAAAQALGLFTDQFTTFFQEPETYFGLPGNDGGIGTGEDEQPGAGGYGLGFNQQPPSEGDDWGNPNPELAPLGGITADIPGWQVVGQTIASAMNSNINVVVTVTGNQNLVTATEVTAAIDDASKDIVDMLTKPSAPGGIG